MRKFNKGDKAGKFFEIIGVSRAREGKILLDLGSSVPIPGSERDEWRCVDADKLVFIGDKPPALEKGRNVKIEITIFNVDPAGVLFDIGDGHIMRMTWNEIRAYWGDEPVPDIRPLIYTCEAMMNESRIKSFSNLYLSLKKGNLNHVDEMFLNHLVNPGAKSGNPDVDRQMNQSRKSAWAEAAVHCNHMSSMFGMIQQVMINYDGRPVSHGTMFILNSFIRSLVSEMSKSGDLYSLWESFKVINNGAFFDYRNVGEFTKFCIRQNCVLSDITPDFRDCVLVELSSAPDIVNIIRSVRDEKDNECVLGSMILPMELYGDDMSLCPEFMASLQGFMRSTAIFG